jgi:hypothetical protein
MKPLKNIKTIWVKWWVRILITQNSYFMTMGLIQNKRNLYNTVISIWPQSSMKKAQVQESFIQSWQQIIRVFTQFKTIRTYWRKNGIRKSKGQTYASFIANSLSSTKSMETINLILKVWWGSHQLKTLCFLQKNMKVV